VHTSAPLFLSSVQNLIFRFLQSRQKVQIWLYEQADLRIEGRIIVRRPFHSPCAAAPVVTVPCCAVRAVLCGALPLPFPGANADNYHPDDQCWRKCRCSHPTQ
jgi:hypothetical protein